MMWKRFSALALVAAACTHEPPKVAERAAVHAPTMIVATSTIPVTRALAGTVRSANVTPLAAMIVGDVLRVHVAEGDRVRKGQLLVEIDVREAHAQRGAASSAVTAAEANAALALTTYNRIAALHARRSATQQELDDADARLKSARAELARARAMASQAGTFEGHGRIIAPFDGVVAERHVDPGAQAAPGVALLTIEDGRGVEVETVVPEELTVRVGDMVQLDGFAAKVARVQPSLDATARNALVTIAVDRPLRPGAFVRVHFPTGRRSAITVPGSAIVQRGQLTSVFVVGSDGVARMRLITLGDGGEILSGLDPGERVVIDAKKVSDGARVS